jgi:hypothetical protein
MAEEKERLLQEERELIAIRNRVENLRSSMVPLRKSETAFR